MTLSTFAYFVGALELLIGIPFIVAPAKTLASLKRMMDDEPLMQFMGVLMVIIGFLVLKDNPNVGTDTAGLIRLLAWLVAIKGLAYTWYPAKMRSYADSWLQVPAVRTVGGFVALIIGVLCLKAGGSLA